MSHVGIWSLGVWDLVGARGALNPVGAEFSGLGLSVVNVGM